VRDDIEIAYLCDKNIRRAQIIKERFRLENARCVEEYHRILEDSTVKAVIVASWPSNHVEVVLEVIESGRHVLVQKPLTLMASSAEELLNRVRQSRSNILALPLIQGIPSFVNLRSLIIGNDLGEISFARIRTTIPGPDDYYADVRQFFLESPEVEPPYRQDLFALQAGSIADMGPYALSAFYYLFGPGTLRFAHSAPALRDRCTLLVLDVNGGTGGVNDKLFCSIETGWNQVRGREVCTVYGSRATACIESTGNLVVLDRGAGERVIDQREISRTPLPLAPLDAQANWIDFILSGREAGFHETVESAVWVSKTIAEVLASRHAAVEASR